MSFLELKEVVRPTDGFKMECVDKPDAVAVVLFDSYYKKIALVKQFRSGPASEIYELPAGVVDKGEDDCHAMLREVKEETGYTSEDIIDVADLGAFYVSPGYTTEKIHLFRARVKPGARPGALKLDEHEDLIVKWKSIKETINFSIDMKTQYGLTKALAIPKKKIGIYGGSFNPITHLHLLTMERAIEEKELDFVILEPVGSKYVKSDILNMQHRCAMAKLGIESNDKIVLGDYESTQTKQPNTIDTLWHYKEVYGWCEIYFICGSDNLRAMCHPINYWSSYEEILERFNIICVQRDNDNVYQDIILHDRHMIKNKNHIHVIHENVVNNISSSAIRNLVQANMSIKYLVPEKVEKYIIENELYK
jgi:nicotinate (nicotinamide) nucleotide adenylyltransferase